MRHSLIQWGLVSLVALAAAGCGGGGGDNGSTPVVPAAPVVATNSAIAAASALAANDTAANPAAAFTVVQAAGITPVTVNSPPVVNFTVFSDGQVKSGLTTANVRLAIAKLVPGSNGNPDQWVNYISKVVTAKTGIGPGGSASPAASAPQATTDTAAATTQLVYNAAGYYSYTFSTDITAVPGISYEPSLTHRVAIQLSYKNAAGATVNVNPYFDFTIVNGKSVMVTDPAKTRKMTNVASCNTCHQKLALHGGGRVDTQFCVMCHNPGTTDPESGNVLTLATMVHKIHAGKRLMAAGQDYTIWGYGDSKNSYAEVGFPQDLRNCSVCHSGANASTPQGDNWKTKPSKEACLTCHASGIGSVWEPTHKIAAGMRHGSGAAATALTNADCADCHKAGSVVSAERVHFNQAQVNAAKYKMNIDSVAFNDTADHKARSVTVKYSLSDPTNGNAAYNLVTSDCTGTTTPSCASTTKFGNLRFYLAYQNMIGQSNAVTEFSAYNNGGSGASGYAYKGTNDGSNHYTLSIAVPDDTATAVAKGTARVVSIGQVVEHKLSATSSTDPRPEVTPTVLVNILAQHAYKELALSGTLQPRRNIVSNDKCNACHGALGSTSGSNTLSPAFHSGDRTLVEACVTCHDANRMSSTVMTNGMALNESYQFKRMIHGIHGGAKRTYPFTHGNPVQGAFGKDGTLLAQGNFLTDYSIRNFAPVLFTAGTSVASGATFDSIASLINTKATTAGYTGSPQAIENYAAEVAYPDATLNCNACHINNSYLTDQSPLGAVVRQPSGVTDPNGWKVISPKAATCTSCHDSSAATTHVVQFGSATFGTASQADVAVLPRETCDDCHAVGRLKAVDAVHGLQ